MSIGNLSGAPSLAVSTNVEPVSGSVEPRPVRRQVSVSLAGGDRAEGAAEVRWRPARHPETVTATTTYKLGPIAGSNSDVKGGRRIAAEGELGASDSLNATVVSIRLDELGGELTSKASGSITVKRREGSSRTIHVGSGTVYKVRGAQVSAPSLADIAVGNRVHAEGTLRADGSLNAIVVRVGKAKAPKVEASPMG